MKELDDKTNKSQKENVQRVSRESSNGGTVQLVDNRSSVAVQRKLQDSMSASSTNDSNTVQRKTNKTGLPDNLKSGIENLSGHSMDDVKVHYNSSKPAQLQAHAYAQGTDIHLASGQEKHLPHEAWHVVQQKQGRVKPTKQLKSKVNINDDAGLEKEADLMGAKALQMKGKEPNNLSMQAKGSEVAQREEIGSNKGGIDTRVLIPGQQNLATGQVQWSDASATGVYGSDRRINAYDVDNLLGQIKALNPTVNRIKILTGTHGDINGNFAGEPVFYRQDLAHEGWGNWPGMVSVISIRGKSRDRIRDLMQATNTVIILGWCFSATSHAQILNNGPLTADWPNF